MYNVTLEKIKSSHDNLRTNSINGICHELPLTGKRFKLFSNEVLTKDTLLRVITTSIVQEVVKNSDNEFTFTTENSEYTLKTML